MWNYDERCTRPGEVSLSDGYVLCCDHRYLGYIKLRSQYLFGRAEVPDRSLGFRWRYLADRVVLSLFLGRLTGWGLHYWTKSLLNIP